MPKPRGFDLFGKRAIGYINWQRTRHAIHRREVLARLVADIHVHKPDHIAITGDLVNIALPAEFIEAAAWLKTVGPPHDVSLVPGNHDAYDISTRHYFARAWADYLRGDYGAMPPAFPYVRRRGPLALIGVSTAIPTAPFMATGIVGRAQRDALGHILSELRQESLCRVIMIHHPPYVAPGRRIARLRDADDLRDVLKENGAEMVLHGHDHRHALVWLEGPEGKIPVIGVPSSSAAPGGHHDPSAYNLFSIGRVNDGWRIEQTVRGFVNETSPDAITVIRHDMLIAP